MINGEKCQHFTNAERLSLGSRAYKLLTIRQDWQRTKLSLSTLFAWKDKYSRELKKNPTIKEFPSACPLLLGEHYMLWSYSAIATATTEGIVKH